MRWIQREVLAGDEEPAAGVLDVEPQGAADPRVGMGMPANVIGSGAARSLIGGPVVFTDYVLVASNARR